MKSYKPTWAARFLVGLLMLLPAVILVGVAIANPEARLPCLISGLLLGAPGLFLWIGIGRMELTVDDSGVTRRGLGGGEIRLRFDEVTEYRYQVMVVHGVEQIIVTLIGPGKIKLTSNWPDGYAA